MSDLKNVDAQNATRYKPPRLRRQGISSNPSNCASLDNTQRQRPKHYDRSQIVDTGLQFSKEQLEKRKQKFADKETNQGHGYGLISRGEDNRLQRDENARVEFFKTIQQEFLELFNESDLDQITVSMSKLSFGPSDTAERFKHTLMQLRKLREALLKFPVDEFVKSVFMFSIRISTRTGHYQTYIPSITHLLEHSDRLTRKEIEFMAELYVLHLAHFSSDNLLALEVRHRYSLRNQRLHQVFQSWRDKDYLKWFQLLNTERDTSKRRIMLFGEANMIHYAIACLTRSYHQLPLSYVQSIFYRSFEDLKANFGCPWTTNGNIVIIQPKK